MITWEPIADGDWPGTLTPDRERRQSRFSAGWAETVDLLEYEAEQLGAADVVVQVSPPRGSIRNAGGRLLSRARTPDHPGVIVSIESPVAGSLQFAVDVFTGGGAYGYLPGWKANVRAVGLGLEALRRVDRYGIASRREQYRGWAQLGSGIDPGAPAPLTVDEALRVLVDASGLSVAVVRSDVDGAFRVAARNVHPDRGGSEAAFVLVSRARDLLRG